MTASPTGPHPTTRQGWPGCESGEPDGVLADRQRLGQGGQVGVERVGYGRSSSFLEHHVLGQGSRVALE